MRRQNIPRIEIHPREFVGAPAAQQFEYVQLDGFGDAPGEYALAAHTIFKLRLSLKQKDSRSVLRYRSGKTGASQPPPTTIRSYCSDILPPHTPLFLHRGQILLQFPRVGGWSQLGNGESGG